MDEKLEALANSYRRWVCDEIAQLEPEERADLRGDYVFVIDGHPRFVVFIDAATHGSALVGLKSELIFDASLELTLSESEASALLFGEASRTRVITDRNTLQRLLTGTMKARVAYLSGAVRLEGDLPVFLRLVSVLKRRGVRPRLSGVAESEQETPSLEAAELRS